MKALHISLVALGLTALLVGCDSAPEAKPQVLPSVIATRVMTEQVLPTQEFVGRTEASKDVYINSQVSGLLLARKFKEGSHINKGEVLFEIDPDKYHKQVKQHQAMLKQNQASFELARNNFVRGKKLVASGAISETDYDELKTRKLESEQKLEQTTSALEEADLNLSYATITAPISGRIGKALVAEGDLVTPERKLANIVQLDPMWVSFQISETQLNDIQRMNAAERAAAPKARDLDVRLRFSSGDYYREVGHIDFIDNRVDSTTGTFSLRASFSNKESSLFPGQYVKVEVANAVTKEAILIPQQAVQEDQEGRFVMLVNADNIIEKRLLRLGERYGIQWEVIDGLKNNDSIVVEGLQRIRPGLEVKASYENILPFSQTEKLKAASSNEGELAK
ncbi:MAG: efflux RND transporter periplasmic adaptor subunit [Oleispira sp.]|nr:efflux RND transporter periplasmic adaptor subunit [Oleispira sp.]